MWPRGCAGSDAGLFADLTETRAYARADREKGRFRSFLLGTRKHFADVHDRGRALKRGGGMLLPNLDDQATTEAEAQIARETKWQPEEAYDREWQPCFCGKRSIASPKSARSAAKQTFFSHLMPYLSASE
jgi:hypothetical protein